VDRSALAERLKTAARAAGFDLVGIARLGPATTADAYRRWLSRGDHAGMAWMARNVELREDPRGLLPGARSAVVVGRRYAPAKDDRGHRDLWGRVARYARGEDYHPILWRRLERVGAEQDRLAPGEGWRACADTAPLLERELAARAGIAAIGKNTMALHPEQGSWFLIGVLLTTLDLPADRPLADLCGSCTRCLDACPTGALPEPFRLDARRCLSYWTIEHRGEIAPEMRPGLADWVFGCDVCQEACPWNRDLEPVEREESTVPESRREFDRRSLLDLPEAELRDHLRRSPLWRAKPEGLRRNARHSLDAGEGRSDGAEVRRDPERPALGSGPRD